MDNYIFDHRDPYEWSKRTASSTLPPLTVCVAITGGVHGKEDNVYSKKGQLLQSNAAAVERIVRLAKDMNRDIATPAQAREILGLSSTPSSY